MVKIHAGEKQTSSYKRLLVSEWKKDFPEKVLSLLWSSIKSDELSLDEPLLRLLNPASNGEFPSMYFRTLLGRIQDSSRLVHINELPRFPENYEPGKTLSKNLWQANRLAVYLTLQGHAKLSGDVEFFRDVQSLAFQAALHVVLPSLTEKHSSEHSLLLHSLSLFPLEFSSLDAGHFCYLISAIHAYLGNFEERIRFLYSSFHCTPPEDHSFLSKAQELWAELLDCERYEEAENFLFSLYGWALPSQQAEIREMIVEAVRYTVSKQQKLSPLPGQ